MTLEPVLLVEVSLVRGGRTVRTWRIAEGEVLTIGSAVGCTLRAARNAGLMPHHASVAVEGGVATLLAEPGAEVLVDGEPVDFAVPGPESVVRIGALSLQIRGVEHTDHLILNVALPDGGAKRIKLRPGRFSVGEAAGGLQLAGQGLMPRHALLEVGEQVGLRALDGELTQDGSPTTHALLGRGRVVHMGSVRLSLVAQVRVLEAPLPELEPEPLDPTADEPEVVKPVVPARLDPVEEDEAPTPLPEPTRRWAPTPAPVARRASRARLESMAAGPGPRAVAPEPIDAKSEPVDVEPEPIDVEPEPIDVEPMTPSPAPPEAATPPIVGDALLHDGDELFVYDEEIVMEVDLPVALLAPRLGAETGGTVIADVVLHRDHAPVVATVVRDQGSPADGISVRVSGDRVYAEWTPAWTARGLSRPDGVPNRLDGPGGELALGETLLLSTSGSRVRIQAARAALTPVAPLVTPGVAIGVPAGVLVAAAMLLALGAVFSRIAPTSAALLEGDPVETFAEVRLERPPPEPPRKPPSRVQMAAERTPVVSEQVVQEVPPPIEAPTEGSTAPQKQVSDVLSRLAGSGLRGSGGKLALQTTALGTGGVDIGQRLAGLNSGKVDSGRSMSTDALVTKSGDAAGTVGNLKGSDRSGARGAVTAVVSQVKVEGQLDRAAVHRVVNGSAHRIQGCYERRLVKNNTLSGRLVIDWTVTLTGSVSSVRVRADTAGDAELSSCVADVVRTLVFDAPSGGEVTISYPFLFRPSGA